MAAVSPVYHPREPTDSPLWGMVMVIHTFGDYARFHPHLHAIVASGLFRPNGTFHCLPKRDLKALEEIFRSKVLAMLKAEGKACPGPRSGINDGLIEKLMAWHHSGFSVHAGNEIARDDRDVRKALAEYILRNAFIGTEDYVYRGYGQGPLSLRHDPWEQQEKLRGFLCRGIYRCNHSAYPRQAFSDGNVRSPMCVDLLIIPTTTVSHRGGASHCSP